MTTKLSEYWRQLEDSASEHHRQAKYDKVVDRMYRVVNPDIQEIDTHSTVATLPRKVSAYQRRGKR